jgi:hypothetical protein
MPKQILKDSRGALLGVIKERGGKLEIYDSKGGYLGRYDPRRNETYNRTGGKVGYGNLLTMLLCKSS